MSALHLDIQGLRLFDRVVDSDASTALRANECDESYADILERVARLSLSPSQYLASPDMDEARRRAAERMLSSFGSPPISPLAGSVTSFENASESDGSPAVSPAPSLYSLTESIREAAIRIEHGRGVNTHSDVYRIAADEQETDRLDRQHLILKQIMGDDEPPLRKHFKDLDSSGVRGEKACLDIGCGSGAWILEVAKRFPQVCCTAVDLVPLPAPTKIPPNLRFEIDDVNLGLEHFEGHFDVVHASHVSSGIRDYYRLISDAAFALRPGGLADFTEGDYRVYDLEHRPIVPTTREIWGNVSPPEGWTGTGMARSGPESVRQQTTTGSPRSATPSPFVARYIVLIGQASRKRGGNVDASALLSRWISGHHAFEEVVSREFWLPTGPWMRNREVRMHCDFKDLSQDALNALCRRGNDLRDNLLEFMLSSRPLLLSTGVPEEVADYLYKRASQELLECKVPGYIRIQNVYSCKKSLSSSR